MKSVTLILFILCTVSACAPTIKQLEHQGEVIKSEEKIALAIINGHYGCREGCLPEEEADSGKNEVRRTTKATNKASLEKRLPLPEGDGGGPTCFQICNDDCDEQCREECPDLYNERCLVFKAEYDWGEDEQDPADEAAEEEPSVEEDQEEHIVRNDSSGNSNTQTNITGNVSGNVTINGPAEKASPVEQAMANRLNRVIKPPKSPFQVGAEQFRGGLNDITDNAVKLGPSLLTGAAVWKAGDVVEKGFEEAGPRLQNSLNPVDRSDHSVNYAPPAAE